MDKGICWNEWDCSYWREKLGIEIGMTKEQAFEKFLEWQSRKRTCERCEEDKLAEFCPVRIICKEAMEYESARGQIDCGSGTPESPGDQETGIGEYEERTGLDLCQGV